MTTIFCTSRRPSPGTLYSCWPETLPESFLQLRFSPSWKFRAGQLQPVRISCPVPHSLHCPGGGSTGHTGQRDNTSTVQSSMGYKSTALYINQNWLMYRIKYWQICSTSQLLWASTNVGLCINLETFCSTGQPNTLIWRAHSFRNALQFNQFFCSFCWCFYHFVFTLLHRSTTFYPYLLCSSTNTNYSVCWRC